MTTQAPVWSIYLVRRSDGALYTGIALDVARRFAAHLTGRGAKALRGRGPLRLVFSTRIGDRAAAQRVERQVKQLQKAMKERFVASRSFAKRWLAGLRADAPGAAQRAASSRPALSTSAAAGANPP